MVEIVLGQAHSHFLQSIDRHYSFSLESSTDQKALKLKHILGLCDKLLHSSSTIDDIQTLVQPLVDSLLEGSLVHTKTKANHLLLIDDPQTLPNLQSMQSYLEMALAFPNGYLPLRDQTKCFYLVFLYEFLFHHSKVIDNLKQAPKKLASRIRKLLLTMRWMLWMLLTQQLSARDVKPPIATQWIILSTYEARLKDPRRNKRKFQRKLLEETLQLQEVYLQ